MLGIFCVFVFCFCFGCNSGSCVVLFCVGGFCFVILGV